jgi:hypothetical protein
MFVAYGGPGGELPEPPEICAARIECDHYNCAQLVLRASIGIDSLLECPPPCEPWSPE